MKMQGQRPYDDKNLPNGSKIQMYVSVEKEKGLSYPEPEARLRDSLPTTRCKIF